MPQTPLEKTEQLEQLRLLEHGVPIRVVTHQEPSPPGVDTMEQYEAFVGGTPETPTMLTLIGLDEAGFKPLLGPCVPGPLRSAEF